jgi:hypothetical protein
MQPGARRGAVIDAGRPGTARGMCVGVPMNALLFVLGGAIADHELAISRGS